MQQFEGRYRLWKGVVGEKKLYKNTKREKPQNVNISRALVAFISIDEK